MARKDLKAPPVTADALRACRLFDGLEQATLERLAAELRVEMVGPGELLMTEGDIATDMFVVLSGELEVSHKGDLDHDVRVALLGPGDWVGEMAILDVQPRSASVRTLAPTATLRLSDSQVRRLLADPDPPQYARVMMNLARELSRRLRVADRVIANASLAIAQKYVRESRRPPAEEG
jgi:CRP/FNR family transcriptional regulator, cyclic AMP receptor protein